MTTIPQINLQGITKLPLTEIVKTDGVGQTIVVSTPHRGHVPIDYKEETGFLTRSMKDKKFTTIIQEIQELEEESKNFLLDNWLKHYATHCTR